MRHPLLLVLLGLIFPAGRANAQERPAEKPRNDASRYFQRPVDLWNAGLALDRSPAASAEDETVPGRVAIRENIWAQPVRTPDGNWMIYVPPKQVLDFLENPSEGTAKAYLGWKREQTEKLRKAMALLARQKETEAPLAVGESPTDPVTPPVAPSGFPFRIMYFKKPSCPHCVSQDAVLREWLKHRPEARLELFLPDEREELWRTYQVRGTPTLVLEGGTPARHVLLVGLQSSAALETALGRLSIQPVNSKETVRKEESR